MQWAKVEKSTGKIVEVSPQIFSIDRREDKYEVRVVADALEAGDIAKPPQEDAETS